MIPMKKTSDFIDTSGMLLTKNAIQGGIKKDKFYRFIAANHFEKAAHGIYLSPEAWKDESFVLHQRCPQAVFSHDEALFYNTQKLKESGTKVFTVKKELLNVGKIEVENSYGHKIPVYDLERTICDLMRSRRYFEILDFQTAIKTYVKRPDKDLNKLMAYAPLFRVEKRIRQYMEVLL